MALCLLLSAVLGVAAALEAPEMQGGTGGGP